MSEVMINNYRNLFQLSKELQEKPAFLDRLDIDTLAGIGSEDDK